MPRSRWGTGESTKYDDEPAGLLAPASGCSCRDQPAYLPRHSVANAGRQFSQPNIANTIKQQADKSHHIEFQADRIGDRIRDTRWIAVRLHERSSSTAFQVAATERRGPSVLRGNAWTANRSSHNEQLSSTSDHRLFIEGALSSELLFAVVKTWVAPAFDVSISRGCYMECQPAVWTAPAFS